MKLRKLEIHNIASIENAVIDFEAAPLAESNVILITGETGAGKSTILDAICLALYATTPRMNNTEMDGKWQENETDEMDVTDTLQLMRKNTSEAYARLSFYGSDGNDYFAEWSVERKRKNLSRTWALKNLTHPEASPQVGNGKGSAKDNEINQTVQSAVGLTFDQFCRTTMLAQGEFTRFLKSGNKEKASILEKITNTEQYAQIGAKVYDLTHHKYEVEMNEVDPAKHEQPMSSDKRTELEESVKTIEEQLKALNAQLETKRKKADWLLTEKNLLNNQTKAQEELKQAQEAMESDAYKDKQQNVKDWDDTEDARKSLTAIDEAKRAMDTADKMIKQLQPQYIMLLNGQEFVRHTLDSISGQIKKIDDEIETEGGQPVSIEDLNKQRDEALTVMGNIGTAKARIEAYFTKVEERQKKLNELKEKKQQIDEKNKQLENLMPQVNEAKTEYEKFDAQYERLNLAVDTLAEKLRANLRVGKRCPICGQQVQSLDEVPHQQELQDIVNEAKKKRDDAKQLFDGLNDQQNKCTIWLNQNVPAYNKDVKAFNEDQSLNKTKEDALLSLGKCNIKSLDEHTQEALGQAKKKAEEQKENLEEKISRAKNREKLQRAFDDLKKDKDIIEPSLDQMCKDLPEWKSLTHQKAEALPNIVSKVHSLSNGITTALTNKETATDTLQTNRDILDAFLGEHLDMTEQRLKQLLQLKDTIGSQRQSIQKANEALANAQGALKNVDEQLEKHQMSKPEMMEGETTESLQDTLDALMKQQGPLSENVGSIKQMLIDDNAKKEKLAELQKDYDKKKAVFERWNKLDKLIGDAKGDKFRLIAQSYILANLVKAANVHMQTLTDRYTLHAVPGQELIILVEDAYQGGVKRPASTISGGESFLVSLALALALSEIGQSLKVETLFIDEGFGTLSGEPLLHAINTLESLHTNNNRQVCAISHREEVKEKIPVQIQVNQNPQSSSSTIDVVPHV